MQWIYIIICIILIVQYSKLSVVSVSSFHHKKPMDFTLIQYFERGDFSHALCSFLTLWFTETEWTLISNVCINCTTKIYLIPTTIWSYDTSIIWYRHGLYTASTKVRRGLNVPILYILLKRSLESVARISLYYRLQTLADSEGVDKSRYNFQRMFPAWPSPISVKSNSF